MRHLLVTTALIGITLWLAGVHAAGDAPAVVVRDAPVKAGPAFGARTAATATAGNRVELGTRLGGWQKVTLLPGRKVSGWLRVYQVRTDIDDSGVVVKTGDADEGGALSGLAAVSRRSTALFGRREMDRRDTGGMTAVVGIRGLSEADLKNARPDRKQLEKLKSYSASAADARRYAGQSGLKSRTIESLPAPEEGS